MSAETQDGGSPGSDREPARYRLRLFVAGDEPNSLLARAVVGRLRDTHLRDRCQIEVVDVFQDYQAAIEHHVVAVPALMVESPPPVRVIVGSLSDEAKLLEVLGIPGAGGLS